MSAARYSLAFSPRHLLTHILLSVCINLCACHRVTEGGRAGASELPFLGGVPPPLKPTPLATWLPLVNLRLRSRVPLYLYRLGWVPLTPGASVHT